MAAKKMRTIPAKDGNPAIKFKSGSLHAQLDVPEGTKIPVAKMRAAAAGKDGPLAQKRALFAKNVLKK